MDQLKGRKKDKFGKRQERRKKEKTFLELAKGFWRVKMSKMPKMQLSSGHKISCMRGGPNLIGYNYYLIWGVSSHKLRTIFADPTRITKCYINFVSMLNYIFLNCNFMEKTLYFPVKQSFISRPRKTDKTKLPHHLWRGNEILIVKLISQKNC